MNFKKRSYQKELLDRDDIPFEDIRRNMLELDGINRRLGGHRVTLKGLKAMLRVSPDTKKNISIMEIGSGGGDNLRVVQKYLLQQGYQVHATGIDINPHCVAFAKSREPNAGIDFICADYALVQPHPKPDIIFSSLFCHHFKDHELVSMLQWMEQNTAAGFFINDLHRHPLAYYSIKILTALFSKSYLVKNDAPVSVLRGFSRKEWLGLLSEAGLHQSSCTWQWAFRWLVTYTRP